MPNCLIGLGANLGDRLQTFQRAVTLIAAHPNLTLRSTSRWHETVPIGGPADQPPYLNGAITLETSLAPLSLAEVIWGIETELGRRRQDRWGPRTIDLDLLLYDRLTLATPSLVLPHPRMAWRRFVLEPAVEVAAEMIHPTTGWTIARLLKHLDSTVPYVAIAGPIGAGKTHLAERLAKEASVRVIAEEFDLDRLAAFYANPAGQAWETELEFLTQRARLLATDDPAWTEAPGVTVSDFWFDQSAAFARVWLSAEQFDQFQRAWSAAKRDVVRPRLIVLLDAPSERLVEQIARRGRRPESRLKVERLEEIREAILTQAEMPDQGPLLRSTDDPDETFREVQAATQAMLSG